MRYYYIALSSLTKIARYVFWYMRYSTDL